jgi:hypothetical protein
MELEGVTKELGQHDEKKTFSNAGENKIPVRFARIGIIIL